MLYLYQGDDERIVISREWSIGDGPPPFHAFNPSSGTLTVVATEKELDLVRVSMENVFHCTGARTLKWGGEQAAFIWNNLHSTSFEAVDNEYDNYDDS